jgi:hypothetical protein
VLLLFIINVGFDHLDMSYAPENEIMAGYEKTTETYQLEAAPTTTNYIDPKIEKRVVRKLDTHVTLLVASLCK